MDILPVFYYNDLLVSNIGDPIGLNLFEPRYKEMCRLMYSTPRFLFMPNFDNYQCRFGDVGLIVQLTNMRPSRDGAYGIQGHAAEFAMVRCTWVEPRTHGLHMAQFWRLPNSFRGLEVQNFQVLHNALSERGWQRARSSSRLAMTPPDRFVPDKFIVFGGLNWVGNIVPFVVADRPKAVISRLCEAWNTDHISSGLSVELIEMQALCLTDSDEEDALIHAETVLPAVVRKIMDVLRCDGGGGVLQQLGQSCETWADMLRPLRLCTVLGMPVDMPTATLAPTFRVGDREVTECFPLSYTNTGPSDDEIWMEAIANHPDPSARRITIAVMKENQNEFFYAWPGMLQVTEASVQAAMSQLISRLNGMRLRVLQQGLRGPTGALANLKEDAARLIVAFLVGIAPSTGQLSSPKRMTF